MELELKHLVAYLPYGLEVIYTHTRERGKIKNLYDIEYYDDIKIGINWMDGEHIWMFKPILRPISDLTKDIEHNGEKFVPIDNFIYKTSVEDFTEFTEQKHNLIHGLKYADIQLLLEWHFDVFGLIEKGLAIDMNYA